ncbi:MAG TPA: AIR carboxylase family protein, partial [Mucilaginibacter sp.]
DSILSILQMPNGIPVATVALNAAKNAGILAAQILSTADDNIVQNLIAYKENLKKKVEESASEINGK